ncbi:hypothetical protein ACTXT7_013464 [Hymenolepis weldensis]
MRHTMFQIFIKLLQPNQKSIKLNVQIEQEVSRSQYCVQQGIEGLRIFRFGEEEKERLISQTMVLVILDLMTFGNDIREIDVLLFFNFAAKPMSNISVILRLETTHIVTICESDTSASSLLAQTTVHLFYEVNLLK